MYRLHLSPDDKKLSVTESTFQYQLDAEKTNRWIFRYDYLRNPPNHYPPSHLQINETFLKPAPVDMHFPDIHFPVDRIPLEAVIRLLVEQFHIKCNEPQYWRQVLAESERSFHEIASHPLSGPEY